jgi:3-phenylpropionate/cinnamic acid dioxygenase small subunit
MAVIDEDAAARIERACAQVVYRSVRAFDAQDWQGFADCFTESGVFLRASEPHAPLRGRAAIRDTLAQRPVHRLTRHFCTNMLIEPVSEQRAEGHCYLLLYTGDASKAETTVGRLAHVLQRVGEYHDQFELTAEGWRIARRLGQLVFYTGTP